MIRHLTTTALGALADADLTFDPRGTTAISGPSQAGKSTTMDAVALALWGRDRWGTPKPVELVRRDAKAAEVALTLASGTTVRRRLTAGGTWTNGITRKDGSVLQGITAEQLAAELGPLADDACRAIVMPGVLLDLALSEGGGAALRDLLSRVLPGPTAAEVLAGKLHDGEPTTEAGAVALRRDAKKRRDEAAGALAEARRRLAEVEARVVQAPTDDEVAAARAAVTAWEQAVADHAAAREAFAAWERTVADHRRAAEAVRAWDDRASRIVAPAEPEPVSSAASDFFAHAEE